MGDWLIVSGFNATSTFVGHFVSSSREREMRDRRDRRDSRGDEREGREKGKWITVKKQNKNIPPLPLSAARTAGLAQLLANISWRPRRCKIHDTFASPNHPTYYGRTSCTHDINFFGNIMPTITYAISYRICYFRAVMLKKKKWQSNTVKFDY